MALKLPDSAVPMGDFPVAKAVDIDFDDGENLQEKFDNGALGGGAGGVKTYTSLSELGLTAPVGVGEIFNAMPDKTMAILTCNDTADHTTDVPMSYGILTIKRNDVGRFSIDYQTSLASSTCNVKRWIGTLKGADGTGLYWKELITENYETDPYSYSGYTHLTGTEDLFTLPCGHYFSEKANTTYNYPLTDSDILNAHIYVLGHLNDPANNQGYRIILYFDNKGRMYRINEWWGSFSNGWENMKAQYTTLAELGLTAPCTTAQIANALKGIKPQKNVAIAIIDCTPNEVTDVPNEYGLLHIETIGFDRLSVRFDGMSSSSCTGSWIGRIKGSGGTFSSVTWSRIDIENRVDELFQSVSSGKTLVANAITGKGVSTATDATFATMATNIGKISGGYKEETKTLIVTSNTNGTEALPFTFSANVIAVKQIVAPSESSYVVPQTSKDAFTINGKELIVYVRGSGTWKVTALISK